MHRRYYPASINKIKTDSNNLLKWIIENLRNSMLIKTKWEFGGRYAKGIDYHCIMLLSQDKLNDLLPIASDKSIENLSGMFIYKPCQENTKAPNVRKITLPKDIHEIMLIFDQAIAGTIPYLNALDQDKKN